VVFTYDTELSLQAAVALVNTATPVDTLTSGQQLDTWYAEYRYTGRRDGDAGELAAMRALRAPLHASLTADRDHAAEIVNGMLAAAHARPQLVRHGDMDWHLHAIFPDAPLVDRVTVETAMAIIDVVRADEFSRLSVCADTGCGGVVLDLTRNRSRRFCSTTCANRNAVAAYRSRKAHHSPGDTPSPSETGRPPARS